MTNTDTQVSPDPADLSLDDLRALRQQLQHEDDVVSYARRVAQARLDLVKGEHARRTSGSDADSTEQPGQHLTGGPARPPRSDEDLSDNELTAELDALCAKYHYARLESLSDDEVAVLSAAINEFELKVSSNRRERFDRLDALSAELVRRYRDGEASVDTLLND